MNISRRLKSFFAEVIREAERNPSFAKHLEEALGLRQVESAQGQKKQAKRKGRRSPAPFSPYDVYSEGESILRQKLFELEIEQLKDMIAEHGMDTMKLAMKWKAKERLVDLIMSAVISRTRKGDAFRADISPSPGRATGPQVDLRVGYKRDFSRSTGERHEYALVVEIKNVGSVTLKDYRVDVLFPKAFLDIESYGAEVRSEETDTHKLIRRIPSHFQQYPNGLHIGDTLEDKQIRYSVTSEHKWPVRMGKRDLMQLPVEVTVVADGMPPKRVSKPIRELQEF